MEVVGKVVTALSGSVVGRRGTGAQARREIPGKQPPTITCFGNGIAPLEKIPAPGWIVAK
ncbi:MAG: hypothetical protein A2512_03630 [Deltaproteobacteria bacterium RIFOXYD12_FULL_56_24]|nr:MAG: hypothetical protein A2512_03630 [Deltaproteobacteria bacterium RIFOXYD12_FULL_56_24]